MPSWAFSFGLGSAQPRGCEANFAAYGTGDLRRLGGADQPTARHFTCIVPSHGECFLAVFLRSLNGVSTGVFGIALATVILPRLSTEHATHEPEKFSQTLDWALRWAVLIAIPSSVALAVLAGPMLTTLFQYGAFAPGDVRMASLSLMAYAIGLSGFIFVKVLAPAYFSRQDTKTPVKVGIIAMVANLVFNLMLVFTLAHAGLALATALSSMVNAGLLYRGLRQSGVYTPGEHWGRFTLAVLVSSIVMGALVHFLAGPLSDWFAAELTERALHLGGLVVSGAVCYALCVLAFGVRPRHLRRPGL